MNEILELNSLLRGDDTEKIDLERHKLSLFTAVEYQESRLLHEFDEVTRLETDLLNYNIRLNKLFNEVHPSIQLVRKRDEAHIILTCIANLCENFEEITRLQRAVEVGASDLHCRLRSWGAHLPISKVKNKAKKAEENAKDMEDCRDYLAAQNSIMSSRLEVRDSTVASLENRLHRIQISLNNSRQIVESHDERASHLQQELFETKLNMDRIECESAELLGIRDALYSQISSASMDQQTAMNLEWLQLDKEDRQLCCLQQMKFTKSRTLKELQHRMRYFQVECDQVMHDLITKETSLNLSSTELRLVDEEHRLLSLQQSTLPTTDFFAHLTALSADIEKLRCNVTASCQRAAYWEDEMRNPLRSKGISGKAQEQQDLRERMHLLTISIMGISEKLEYQIVSRVSLENQRKFHPKYPSIEKEIEELKTSSYGVEVGKTLANTLRCLKETIECGASTLDNCFTDLTTVTAEYMEYCARKRLCLQAVEEKMRKFRQMKLESMYQEINKRTAAFAQAQKRIFTEAISSAEDVLLRDDHKFQETISTLQNHLLMRQDSFHRLIPSEIQPQSSSNVTKISEQNARKRAKLNSH